MQSKQKTETIEVTEVRELDTLAVKSTKKDTNPNEAYSLEVYRASYTRTIDILHTKLDLSFDFEQEAVLGEAWIKYTPIFDPVSEFYLDAQYFDIHELSQSDGQELKFDYEDSLKVLVHLPQELERGDTAILYMNYTAHPGKGEEGGSAAITSSQGLFFIDPRDENPNKPTQIWTQGETEHNSNWFPTVDKPNERTTQEIALTVPDYMETLSNGVLVKSEKVGEELRKDFWKLDQAHAPYLFMIAIGDYAVVEDQWEDVPVHYYVEKEYRPYAPQIFDHTPEMLSYFSDILDYRYPWPKYDQVVVRNFVSGAMENTTAVIFGDFVQNYGLDLVGNDNDYIVAHEMFHHWFGDLVTCESWANLTMNEGFANYSEYLWKEYKEGRDMADYHRMNEFGGYLQQARMNKHPLIYFQYQRAEQMFDAHSYNKGGLVLHMLRDYLGEEAFFAGLNLFLERHAYTAVEAHDLRLAMEDISGEDLNWFFNQWYFKAGHPKLYIKDEYQDGVLTLTIEQTQDAEENPPIFILPTEVDIYRADGTKLNVELTIDEREEVLSIPLDEEPQLVLFDPRDILLAEIQHDKSNEELALQYRSSSAFRHRISALKGLATADEEEYLPVFEDALRDPVWTIRSSVIKKMPRSTQIEKKEKLIDMATNDPAVQVRTTAIEILAEITSDTTAYLDLVRERLNAGEAGQEMAIALRKIFEFDAKEGIELAKKHENVKSFYVQNAIADIYGTTGNPEYIEYFDRLLPDQTGYSAFPFFNAYSNMVAQLPKSEMMERINNLKEIGMNPSTGGITRYAATKSIYDVKEKLAMEGGHEGSIEELKETLQTIKENESSDRLKNMYENFN
jgi:aminopeptidase N